MLGRDWTGGHLYLTLFHYRVDMDDPHFLPCVRCTLLFHPWWNIPLATSTRGSNQLSHGEVLDEYQIPDVDQYVDPFYTHSCARHRQYVGVCRGLREAESRPGLCFSWSCLLTSSSHMTSCLFAWKHDFEEAVCLEHEKLSHCLCDPCQPLE